MKRNHVKTLRRIEVSAKVIGLFRMHCQADRSSVEACGVLIGSFDQESRLKICCGTSPGKEDKRRRRSFEIKDPGHQQAVDQAHRNSEGRERLVGTWHTHPEEEPTPSRPDLRGWDRCRLANPDFPEMVFVIVGTKICSGYGWAGTDYVKVFSRRLYDDH